MSSWWSAEKLERLTWLMLAEAEANERASGAESEAEGPSSPSARSSTDDEDDPFSGGSLLATLFQSAPSGGAT